MNYVKKVKTIRSQFNSDNAHPIRTPSSPIPLYQLLNFDPLTDADEQKLILDTGKKYCRLILCLYTTYVGMFRNFVTSDNILDKSIFRIWSIS
jgi:hypothetical protein